MALIKVSSRTQSCREVKSRDGQHYCDLRSTPTGVEGRPMTITQTFNDEPGSSTPENLGAELIHVLITTTHSGGHALLVQHDRLSAGSADADREDCHCDGSSHPHRTSEIFIKCIRIIACPESLWG